MIDYVKILVSNIQPLELLNNNSLEFKTEVSERTGELSTKKTAKYHHCEIVIYDSGKVFFKGSIHKLWNSLNNTLAPNHKEWKTYKGFNGNQFTFGNIIEVRKHLEQLFNCEPQQMIFQNIEFGINATPNFNPQLFLKGLLYHNGIPFEFRHKEHFAQTIHQRYFFKIYNKSNQYGMSEYTLRIELKVIKIEDLKNLQIQTFANINKTSLEKAKELLLKRFDEVVYYDNTIQKENLTESQKQVLTKYSNPRFWLYDLKPNFRFRHKKRLNNFKVNNSQNLHQKIKNEIVKKCSIINRLSKYSKCSIINHSSIGLNMLQNSNEKTPKKCAITGLDLNLEKEGSKYIKTTTLKNLHTYNANEFQKLCSLLLSRTKGNKPKFEQNLIKHLAKQIRNKYFNPRPLKQLGYKQKKYRNQYELIFI